MPVDALVLDEIARVFGPATPLEVCRRTDDDETQVS
jgi:hypothetical protein